MASLIKTNFYLDPELLDQVRALSEQTRMSSSEIYRRATREYVARNPVQKLAPTDEIGVIKRALFSGNGTISVSNDLVLGSATDPATGRIVPVHGYYRNGKVSLFSANVHGSKDVYFLDEMLSRSQLQKITAALAATLKN